MVGGALAAVLAYAPAAGGQTYPNPQPLTGDLVPVPDPTLLVVPDLTGGGGTDWYVYSTGNQSRGSMDHKGFGRMSDFIAPKPLWWQTYNNLAEPWAPDAVFADGKYWMYYSVSKLNSSTSAIGLATSLTGLPGTWTDSGSPVLTSAPGSGYNAIDPGILVDGNQRWMVFGSYHGGIFIKKLDPATGRPIDNTKYNIAKNPVQNAVEGPSIVKRGGYYYLFGSYGSCCVDFNSSYHIKVGRSTSPTGPYFARDGVSNMISGAGETILASHGDWVRGPGGQEIVHDPEDGRDKLVYHYFDRRFPLTPGDDRRLGINNLAWDSAGWPYVAP
jgi:arabinan endo-1,5-alpha-L-arabinosidase